MEKVCGRTIFIVMFIFAFCFSTPSPSKAVPSTNSFTGSTSVPDLVTFMSIDSLKDARIYHTATLLNNSKVLVAGGYKPNVPSLNSAELYNPTLGTWNNAGSLINSRYFHTATMLKNGLVLVVGGIDVGALDSAELYDPYTGIWTSTGSINFSRYRHTATLLNNGKVLIAGGTNGSSSLNSAELFDPDTGTWSITGRMSDSRDFHTATLLGSGKVLVAGGRQSAWEGIDSAELYDPDTGTWSAARSMNGGHFQHAATLLNNGKVLVTGEGIIAYVGTITAEMYDPTLDTWTTAGSMNTRRYLHTATLLNNGKVLVIGGGGSALAGEELYDPSEDTWKTIGNLNTVRGGHTTTLINNGKVLVIGGSDRSAHYLSSVELGTIQYANTYNGTLTLPSGWLNNATISLQFMGTSTFAAINAGSLSNDNTTWGNWIPATPSETITTSWDVGSEGADKPVFLRLRDNDGQVAIVVNGTVNLDLTKPLSTMTPLPLISLANISLNWSGSDALSGVAGYDVQVRAGLDGAWTDVLVNTANTSANYAGVSGVMYYFRTRAHDVAGNVEDWPLDYDVSSIIGPKLYLPLINK